MIDRIYDYMIRNKMIVQGTSILVAVSGGADSMCLLEALRELQERVGLRLKVLHVHHGLRESAEGDLQYVSDFCKSTGISFEAVRVDAAGYAAGKGLSVEEAARHLRYEALEAAAKAWDSEIQETRNPETQEESNPREQASPSRCRIAVAHHIEDQAETVLFNLARGSRLRGLRGMLPVNGRIIRPLLECSRGDIERFLRERGIAWREDETNEDVRYARNLLRHEVMPLLEQINAGAIGHIATAAEEVAEAEAFLKGETERALAGCCRKQDSISVVSIPALEREPAILQRRIVYELIAKAAGRKKDLQDVHVQAVLKLAGKNGNGRLDVYSGVCVEKSYDNLIFSRGAKAAAVKRWPMDAAEYSCRVFDFDGDMSTVSRKQYTKWLDYDKIGAFPSFRTRREGDRITLDTSGRSKTIARYMIDAKVPGELRGRIVLPTVGSEILWIPAGKADGQSPEPAEPASKAPDTLPETKETQGRSSDSGRINAAYMVSSHTSRILEIRWEPGAG